jgi:hypothetical protein
MKVPFIFVFNCSFLQYFDCIGIVIFPFVFFAESKKNILPSTIKHELCHVAQVRRHGIISFYVLYHVYLLKSYIKLGNYHEAYMDNPFEKEAYKIEKSALTDSEIDEIKWEGYRTDKELRNAIRREKMRKHCKTI